MLLSIIRLAVGACLGLALALPAAAEDSSRSSTKKAKDPNEVVCEKQEVLGSRLAMKKVCMTRAEWAEQKRSDREVVGRSQVNTMLKRAN